MCGIIGMVSTRPVNQELYDGLTVLQHRGQDAAGIVTCKKRKVFLRKDNGLVKDVFHTRHMLRLLGNMGIGHVRYPTAGCASSAEAQPFFVNSPYGIALAHNGNLTNAKELKSALFKEDLRHINTESDSEVLLNIFAHELQRIGKITLDQHDIFNAVTGVFKRCQGAYAVVALIPRVGVVAFRDPLGIRPLCLGVRTSKNGEREYIVASESVAIDTLGFRLIGDVEPGEAIYITPEGELHRARCVAGKLAPCLFEFVYLARPDSILDDVYVHKTRLRMGERLGEKIRREWGQHDIDVVIPIPDTSRTSALQLANTLGVTYREGFIKNRYIGRTFIMPGQKVREKSVRQKLNPLGLEFRGKKVLLVDDSIVRGTTSAQIIQMARDAGAEKVYFASASPPVRYPNVYGIDMPSAQELVAHDRSEAEICQAIGADKLIFQDLEDLTAAVTEGNSSITQFDTSVFTGDYITGTINRDYLDWIEEKRNDQKKSKKQQRSSSNIVGVHNDV
jgi:amidophosphoribosyltransferase